MAESTKKSTPIKEKASKAVADKSATKPAPKTGSKDVVITKEVKPEIKIGKPSLSKGKYIYATGRRKTAVANVRLFSGSEKNLVNKNPMEEYFDNEIYRQEIDQPFQYTGFGKDFYYVATIKGGGTHAQAQALRHGIATALASLNEEIRNVMKKNGLLTRDDRKKERKKPGLKRARRAPQWAKR